MKHLFYVFLFIISFSHIIADELPCGEAEDCEIKNRPYRFCNSEGEVITLCTDDPLNPVFENGWWSGFTHLLKFNPNSLPLCIEFDGTGPDIVSLKVCGNGECYDPEVIYRKSDFNNDLNAGMNIWNCICGWEEDPCSCTISIGFVSVNNFEFENPDDDFSSNSIDVSIRNPEHNNSFNPNDCEIDCDDIHIYLNNTLGFTEREDEGSPHQKFYVSETFVEGFTYTDGRYPKAYNLRNVISRSLGRIMGLTSGTDSENGDCSLSSSVLRKPTYGVEYKEPDNDDLCVFKILYCPELTSVNEDRIYNDTEVFPNPSKNYIDIKLYCNSSTMQSRLKVYNSITNLVMESDLTSHSIGNNIYRIDVSEFTSGLYFYNVVVEDSIINGKFIVLR